MNRLRSLFATLLFICGISPAVYAMENTFYILRSDAPDRIASTENTVNSLKQNFKAIHILISQAYQIDENGMVWGHIDSAVADLANKNKIKLMPLITNTKFDKIKAHQFLSNPEAQKTAIQSIIDACKKNHYYGVQFDFEMIPLTDRNLLTAFYVNAAKALHEQGFVVSFAVAPVVDDNPQTSYFLKKVYENWEGAYDLKALAGSADFVTVMAYNQHAGKTTPGSTASLPWVEKTVQYTLRFIPAEKISLGVPAYSTYWYTDKSPVSGKIAAQMTAISYREVEYLLQKYHASLQWDETNHIPYSVYNHDWLNEYIFAENAKSFADKSALVEKYHLRGLSVFDLGSEDPAIWKLLPS